MANYKLKAEITADASGYEAGVKKAEKASKKLSTSVSKVIQGLGKNGLVGALGAVGLASQGLTSTLGAVVKIARKVSETVNECTNAYKNQLIAERELDTAIQNNPFVTGASADALKQFASEMQKVSNYGDEELIPMMANLVSLGRTEAETMQIMSVAMDMSAGMGISLDTAITQLNATLNGNIGRLGQQNAELKDLTEVELRSGKAIEILGEKFKGLSGATADTSKQLQNMKGDFKEALGQFTLPSSDMWNKFWAGFYEKGIEVIKQFNEFLDVNIIGKMMLSNFEAYAKTLKSEKDKGENIQSYLWTISDDELNAMDKYLEKQKSLNETQKLIYERTQKEVERRKFLAELRAEEEAIEAENAKKKADAEAKAKAEAEKQAEIAKKKTDWESKLLDQRIEMLETERDRAIELAEEEGQDSYSIWSDYNDKILELKLERLNKEKEKALEEEGLTAEGKIFIEEYYKNEALKIIEELKKKKKKKNEEEEKDEKNKFAIMLGYAKQYLEKMKQIFSKVVSSISKVVQSGLNFFKKLISINVDDILDTVLAFEDSVLTFFVETLPKLPNMIGSIIQSIQVLFQNLKANIKAETIADIIFSMLKQMSDSLPQLITDLLDILTEVINGAIDGIIKWIDNGGVKTLLSLLLKIQQTLEKIVTDNIDKIADAIASMLPDLVETLVQSIVSASQTLGKIAKTLLPLIAKIITAIIDVITDDRVIESSIEAIQGIIEGLIPALVELIVNALPKIINLILIKLPMYTPSLIMGIVEGLADGFMKVDWGEALKGLWNGLVDFFSGIWDAIVDLFVDKIGGGFKKAFEQNSSTQTGSIAGDVGLGILTGGVSTIGHWLHWWADGTQNATSGLSVVGESGPELVRFRGGEQVINAKNTQKLLQDTNGSTNNFNVTFNNLQDTSAYAMMNQLKQYNRAMAINGVL